MCGQAFDLAEEAWYRKGGIVFPWGYVGSVVRKGTLLYETRNVATDSALLW